LLVDLGHLLLAGSVTEALGVAAGRILVTGAHGGESAARFAIALRPERRAWRRRLPRRPAVRQPVPAASPPTHTRPDATP